MLLERISQAGIARVLQVSEDTVQRYVNSQAAAVKKQVEVTPKEKKRLNVQMDELCHSLIVKEISSGSGWHWMPRLGKLLVHILEIVAQYRLNLYGIQCHQCTVNVQ
jgi:hypothetical protein